MRIPKRKTKPVWWLSPITLPILLAVTLAGGSLLIPKPYFINIYGTTKHITTETTLLVILTALTFSFFAFLGKNRRGKTSYIKQVNPIALSFFSSKSSTKIYWLLFTITLFAYLIFYSGAISSGLNLSSLIYAITSGDGVFALKSQYLSTSRIAGVTSFTQMGVPAVTLGTYLYIIKPKKFLKASLALIIILGIIKSFLVSERLALIELIIPIVLVNYSLKSRQGKLNTKLIALFPIIAVFFALAFFTAFEFFRSFSAGHLKNIGLGDLGIIEYGAVLFMGYYATSINNSALLYYMWNANYPFFSLSALWKMTSAFGLGNYYELTGFDGGEHYAYLLKNYGFSGFNNPGGHLLPIIDFGLAFGLIIWAILGFIAGALYSSFTKGTFTGLLIYPLFFIGIIEMPRILYWSDARSPAIWIGCLIIVIAFKRYKSRKARSISN